MGFSNLEMIHKGTRLDEITKTVSVEGAGQGYLLGTPKLKGVERGAGITEEIKKEWPGM